MTRRSMVGWAVALLVLLLAGVFIGRTLMQRQAAAPAAAAAASAAPVPPAAVELTRGDVVSAALSPLARTLEISGGLKAVSSALVKARVAAEVRELTVREGDTVRAGQLIGRLDDTEFGLRLRQAEEQAASAKAQLDIAQRSLANNRALVDQGFISKNALDTSAMSAASADAMLQAARVAVELTRKAVRDSEIRAPLSGLVSQRFVQPGERVPIDARLIEIIDLSRIELEAAVAPEDVLAMRVGQSAQLNIDGLAQPLNARVARINPSTQSGTRAVLAYLALEPLPGLRQGLFARGQVELSRRTALVVPASAVRSDQARPYVLVVDGGVARVRPVSTGERGQALVDGAPEPVIEVTQGLQPGDLVLRAGVGGLRDGTPVRLPAAAASGAPAAPTLAASGPANGSNPR